MINRHKEVEDFSEQEKSQVYFTFDGVIRKIKNRRTYAVAR